MKLQRKCVFFFKTPTFFMIAILNPFLSSKLCVAENRKFVVNI